MPDVADLPDFAAMSDEELWLWNQCPGPKDHWSDRHVAAVLAQTDELVKRADAKGLSYEKFIGGLRNAATRQ
jgi:hypothetical protein